MAQRWSIGRGQTIIGLIRWSLMLDETVDTEARRLALLTPRELEVLEMVSWGLTNAEAALRLNLSIHAIKFHLAAIYRRLGVTNRTEAAVTYLRWGNSDLGAYGKGD
jgi:DNA-binding NarL/FixJ family response regulator